MYENLRKDADAAATQVNKMKNICLYCKHCAIACQDSVYVKHCRLTAKEVKFYETCSKFERRED